MALDKVCNPNPAGTVTRSSPSGRTATPPATSTASSAGASIRAQRWYRRSPSAVSDSRRVVRWSSRTPSRVSRSDTLALTTELETPSLSAAPVKVLASTTRANTAIETSSSRDADMVGGERAPSELAGRLGGFREECLLKKTGNQPCEWIQY